MADPAKLALVKQRTWFYPFVLPDGTPTRCDIPEAIQEIHHTRARHLRSVIARKVAHPEAATAIDFASHEGFFAVELARHVGSVRGYELRRQSVEAAGLIAEVLDVANVSFTEADLTCLPFDPNLAADFVLVFGLLYHLENPIQVLRLASQMTRQHILIESQVFPYDISGQIENGAYDSQRPFAGVFALTSDFPADREGGSGELALVPSLNALLFLLRQFGFEETEVIAPGPGDYEQFRRGARVMIYGRKQTTPG
jgi:tRNA (mo5U34)-methyltransferase